MHQRRWRSCSHTSARILANRYACPSLRSWRPSLWSGIRLIQVKGVFLNASTSDTQAVAGHRDQRANGGPTLRSSRLAAVRWLGAEAPRASEVQVSVLSEREGRERLSERT